MDCPDILKHNQNFNKDTQPTQQLLSFIASIPHLLATNDFQLSIIFLLCF